MTYTNTKKLIKPCSAWCEPEKGIHRYVTWQKGTIEEGNCMLPRNALAGPSSCLPMGTKIVHLLYEPATEYPGTSPHPGFPDAALVTAQINPIPSSSEPEYATEETF